MNKKTLCVILHYGSVEDTWKCVGALVGEKDIDIVVSDNDPSQDLLVPECFEGNVKLYRTGGKVGFAEGNNSAASFFLDETHDSIFILNNDAYVEKNSIMSMRAVLSDPEIGSVGPCMPYSKQKNKIWACGGWVSRVTLRVGGHRQCDQNGIYDVDYLPGAAILCRADVWKVLGGLPEKYFLAYEEVEFAFEIKRLGYRVVVNPEAIIYHDVGMSSNAEPMYRYNSVRNKIKFGRYLHGRFFGLVQALIFTAYGLRSKSIKNFKLRLLLWCWAVRDELTDKPLDRDCLLYISDKAKSIG